MSQTGFGDFGAKKDTTSFDAIKNTGFSPSKNTFGASPKTGFGALASPSPNKSGFSLTNTPSTVFETPTKSKTTPPLGIERSPFNARITETIENESESDDSNASNPSSNVPHPSDINSSSITEEDEPLLEDEQLDNLQFCSPKKPLEDQLSYLSAQFDMRDNEKTGYLDITNIDLILNELKTFDYNDDLILSYKRYYCNQTYDEGKISKQDFLEIFKEDSSYEPEEESESEDEKEDLRRGAQHAFDHFSINGVLPLEYFDRALDMLGESIEDVVVQEIKTQLGRDGMIEKEDFMDWYMNWVFDEENVDLEEEEDVKQELFSSSMSNASKKAFLTYSKFDTDKTNTLPTNKFTDLIEELGEGFYGEELDEQIRIVDPEKTGYFTQDSFVNWYNQFVTSKNEDEDMDEEVEEAKQEASEAFDKIALDRDYILYDDFSRLIKALGATYCEEEHGKIGKNLMKGDKIFKGDVVHWYADWLFNDESDEDSSDEDKEEKDETGVDKSKGWDGVFV